MQDFRDDFSAGSLSNAWQWDFRHSQPTWQIKQGTLLLAGSVGADNLAGTALTVRPLMGTYTVTTEVAKHNATLKSLVLYGDASQAVGVGVRNDTVEVWAVKDKKRTVLQAVAIKAQQPVQMKMTVEQGSKCRFFWLNSNSWIEVKTGGTYYKADFLPPWDRSPRPGLLHQGATTDPATFNSFAISY
ncbi:hypothetical protein [Hymenobacter profundi]|uniref:beta-xylosidase family glycoside hydrolase n=1 Tax=Hymenobacter profundi TaxID=1982110 RepID=UPI0031B8943F